MTALVCGSIAYDNIMLFDGNFEDQILAEQLDNLNISFLSSSMRREFGGCAINIAYNLKLLGYDSYPMGSVGKDFGPYSTWLESKGISQNHIKTFEEVYTAQAFIITDNRGNQITVFHPGAMDFSDKLKVSQAEDADIAILSPDGRKGMISHAAELFEAEIPFIFDPGQGLPMFNEDNLNFFIEKSTWVIVNDYECQMLLDRVKLNLSEIRSKVEAFIVTHGANGSTIYSGDQEIKIPAVKAAISKDPTGCGDAYRAGLIYGLSNSYDWLTIGRVSSLLGSIKVEYNGTQNHFFTIDEFKKMYLDNFSTPIPE